MQAEINYKDIGQKITELIRSDDMKDFPYVSDRTKGSFYGVFLRAGSMYDTNTMLLERIYKDDSIGTAVQKVQRFNKETEEASKLAKERKTKYFDDLDQVERDGLPPEEYKAKSDELKAQYINDIELLTENITIGYEEVDAEIKVFRYFDADKDKAVCPVFSVKDEEKETLETYYELIVKQMLSVYDILIYGGANKLGTGDYYILLHKVSTPQYIDVVAKFLLKEELDKVEGEDDGKGN